MKRSIVEFSVIMGVGLVIALIVSLIKKLYWQTDITGIMLALCDSFSVAGLLLLCVGVITVCSNGGTFDVFGFAGKKFIGLFQSDEKRKKNKESFYEYRTRKHESKRSYASMLICGGVYLLIGIVFLICYYYL
ncbi:MAG: DUF3899 domain-containing protein [Roseburia sp.]|nr:DUF3899 domain-containing protein [Roseburia sp.]